MCLALALTHTMTCLLPNRIRQLVGTVGLSMARKATMASWVGNQLALIVMKSASANGDVLRWKRASIQTSAKLLRLATYRCWRRLGVSVWGGEGGGAVKDDPVALVAATWGAYWGCCLNRARTVRAPCAHRASFCVFCVHQIHNA